MESTVRTKLIWDIDGTLLKTNGAAAIAFAKAVSNFAGKTIQIDRKSLSGFTDYEIAMTLLKNNNIRFNSENINQILRVYVENLPLHMTEIGVDVINNSDQVLKKLLNHPNLDLLIGTGNCLAGARQKLKHVGLLKFFLDKNIFCSSELLVSRDSVIQKAKNSLAIGEIGIVIGDSPRDIASAKKMELKVIAVPTGAHSFQELNYYNPTITLDKDWSYDSLVLAIENIKF